MKQLVEEKLRSQGEEKIRMPEKQEGLIENDKSVPGCTKL